MKINTFAVFPNLAAQQRRPGVDVIIFAFCFCLRVGGVFTWGRWSPMSLDPDCDHDWRKDQALEGTAPKDAALSKRQGGVVQFADGNKIVARRLCSATRRGSAWEMLGCLCGN